jgi:hypothetical protein
MRLIALAILVLVTGHCPAPAAAQQQASRDMVQMYQRVCARVCATENKQCEGKPAPDKAACDTSYVGCHIGCTQCVGEFAACMRRQGSDFAVCDKEFAPCAKAKLQARRKERPLIRFRGGDGSSQATAVMIEGAQNEPEGITAESLWILKHHEGWRKAHQALIHGGSRSFDAIDYETPDGKHTVWFDITSFFGKM